MKNKILLLTHGSVGKAMLSAANSTLGELPESVYSISVSRSPDTEAIAEAIEKISPIDETDHLLILTDLFGSTPCNLAAKHAKKGVVAVISGVNLGMLIKSINYISSPFNELVDKAALGGKDCIKICEPNTNDN